MNGNPLIAVALNVALAFTSISQISAEDATKNRRKVVIDTPNYCCKVDKVEGDNVYLTSLDQNCIKGPAKAAIEINTEAQSINIYYRGVLWKRQEVSGMAGISPDVTRELSIKAEKQAERLAMPEKRHEEWAKKRAKEFTDVFNSTTFQNRVQDETVRIKKEIFSSPLDEYYKDGINVSKTRKDGNAYLSKNERVYVFVSSSIPIQTIRNYAASIDKAKDPNIVMVLRGFLNGMDDINSTLTFVSRILVKDPTCDNNNSPCAMLNANLEIDPLLFRRYGITEVPAVVHATDVQVLGVGGSEGVGENASVGRYYRVMGDAALDYHIETINSEAHKQSLQGLAEAMRKGFYQ